MKASESIIGTFIMYKLHDKPKRVLDHRCQVYPLDNPWKRGSFLVGGEEQGYLNLNIDIATSVQFKWSSSHPKLIRGRGK